ncbi:hypothetical protein GGX14DRAFT_553603 [Mycena pura]|uniref:Uncharacterized protein n=1 Tax=Mycena pura TaxID=153505 RepID=A0AAD7E5L8_9AGAR|nr:hypothetical protein GGX14DRAFT_553603 [Mycena pura]
MNHASLPPISSPPAPHSFHIGVVGIGHSTALPFAREGAKVIVSDNLRRRSGPVADVLGVAGDVGAGDFPMRIIDATEILSTMRASPSTRCFTQRRSLHTMPDDAFDIILKIHVRTPFRLVRQAVRLKDWARLACARTRSHWGSYTRVVRNLAWRRLPTAPPGSVGPKGFDSGFLSDLHGSMQTFTYTAVDTAPHFGACMRATGAHCLPCRLIWPNDTCTGARRVLHS